MPTIEILIGRPPAGPSWRHMDYMGGFHGPTSRPVPSQSSRIRSPHAVGLKFIPAVEPLMEKGL
jgi:hypothetical protein